MKQQTSRRKMAHPVTAEPLVRPRDLIGAAVALAGVWAFLVFFLALAPA